MGELTDVRKYLYWSERRISALVEDNGLHLTKPGTTTLKTPSGPFLPQVEYQVVRKTLTRHEISVAVERYLAGVTVSDFVTPPPARFAAGRGTIFFAEFIDFSPRPGMVSIFTETRSSTGSRIAVCMFGSKDNLAEVITDSAPDESGWSSSSAPAIARFIESRCTSSDQHWDDRRDLAKEAVHAVRHLGMRGGDGGADPNKPWRRSFSYGHLGEIGEWMTEVYFDVEFNRGSDKVEYEYDRVVIGAPLWVRTPSIRALRLYDEYSSEELEGAGSSVSPPGGWRGGLRAVLRLGRP